MLPSFGCQSACNPLPPLADCHRQRPVRKVFCMANLKLLALSAIVVPVLLSTSPAMAEKATKQVRHADLDLATSAGQTRLQTRIKQAVKQVCGSLRGFTTKEHQDQKNCERKAFEQAAPESERVIAAYMEQRRLTFEKSASIAAN